ncbi:MAG: signal recognition particle protein [Candidatus Diapherotrites archaeon]|nr:signal recognition particle protein [Candidatus Diapherotrites archaeon]
MVSLGKGLRKAFDRLTKSSVISENEIGEFKKEVQRALISSDVNIQTVMKVSKEIEAKARDDIARGFSKKEHLVKGTYDLLVDLLGGEKRDFELKKSKILLVGLFGTGKTTTIGKVARLFSKKGYNVGIIGADVWRPAAYEQLKQYVSKLKNVVTYGEPDEKDPVKIIRNGFKALDGKYDVLLVDSAGRSGLDEELTKEIKAVHKIFDPDDTWLIIAADMGQSAGKQAQAFHDSVGVSGVILTKMDGSAKGGGAIAACAVTQAPVLFIGTGEKIEDLEVFDPQRYLSSIMGYGDLEGLLEKAADVAAESELSPEELLEKDFNLDIFYSQLKNMKKMGPLKQVMGMMGVSDAPDDVFQVGEDKMKVFQYVMDSMSKKERLNPDLLNKSRILRIAKGSGRTENEVRELLKNYKKIKKMFNAMKGGKLPAPLRKMAKQYKSQGMQMPDFKNMQNFGMG